jgi:hypothetical protein
MFGMAFTAAFALEEPFADANPKPLRISVVSKYCVVNVPADKLHLYLGERL